MYQENGKVYQSVDDQCHKCTNIIKCPLMEALIQGMVVLTDEVVVINCGMFEGVERHLKLVPSPPPE